MRCVIIIRYMADQIKEDEENVIFLNAGDFFQVSLSLST